MHKLYRPYLPKEAAARALLEVSLRRWLRKIQTDSSSGPFGEDCIGALAKASFHNQIPLTHPFNENYQHLRLSMFVDLY